MRQNKTGATFKHNFLRCLAKNCPDPEVYERTGRNNEKRNHICRVHKFKHKEWEAMTPENVQRFVAAGKWPLEDGDAVFEDAEPPPLPLGPGQSFAQRKQTPLTRWALLAPGSPGNVALTRAWVRLVQIPNLLPGPRKSKTRADELWAKELRSRSTSRS